MHPVAVPEKLNKKIFATLLLIQMKFDLPIVAVSACTLGAAGLLLYLKFKSGLVIGDPTIGFGKRKDAASSSSFFTAMTNDAPDDPAFVKGCVALGGTISKAQKGGFFECTAPIGIGGEMLPVPSSVDPRTGKVDPPGECPDTGADIYIGDMRKIDCIAVGGFSPAFDSAAITEMIPCRMRACPAAEASRTADRTVLGGINDGIGGYGVFINDVPEDGCREKLMGRPSTSGRCLAKLFRKTVT